MIIGRDQFMEPFDRRRDEDFIGNQKRDLISQPVTVNDIFFQVYQLRYHPLKHARPTTVVGIEITAGNIALPAFDETFVTAVGQGNFEDGVMKITEQLFRLTRREIGNGEKIRHPLYDAHAAHQQAEEETWPIHYSQPLIELEQLENDQANPAV